MKTLSIILILVNVRHTNDLEKYIIIVSLSTLISNLIILKSIFKLVNLKKYQYNWNRIKQHFLANNKLFILQVAIQLYSYIDKIMFGIFW